MRIPSAKRAASAVLVLGIAGSGFGLTAQTALASTTTTVRHTSTSVPHTSTTVHTGPPVVRSNRSGTRILTFG